MIDRDFKKALGDFDPLEKLLSIAKGTKNVELQSQIYTTLSDFIYPTQAKETKGGFLYGET